LGGGEGNGIIMMESFVQIRFQVIEKNISRPAVRNGFFRHKTGLNHGWLFCLKSKNHASIPKLRQLVAVLYLPKIKLIEAFHIPQTSCRKH
jgi:hypothetical protein